MKQRDVMNCSEKEATVWEIKWTSNPNLTVGSAQQCEGHSLLLPLPFVGQSAMLSAPSQYSATADPHCFPTPSQPAVTLEVRRRYIGHRRRREDGRCRASAVFRHGWVMTSTAITAWHQRGLGIRNFNLLQVQKVVGGVWAPSCGVCVNMHWCMLMRMGDLMSSNSWTAESQWHLQGVCVSSEHKSP